MTADNRSVHAVCCFLNPILPSTTQAFRNRVLRLMQANAVANANTSVQNGRDKEIRAMTAENMSVTTFEKCFKAYKW